MVGRRCVSAAFFVFAWLLSCTGVACGGEVLVAAAASLHDAFRGVAGAYEAAHPETRVVLHFASSGTLCAQIELGAPVDLYASASQAYMDRLERQRLVQPGTRRDFAANRMVLVEPAEGGTGLVSLDGLLSGSVARIALGDPSHVPAGRYAKEALMAVGLWDKLQQKLVLGMNVRQVHDYVFRGEVDAGIVFASDARTPGVRIAAVLPEDLHSPIRYPAAVLKGAPNPEGSRAVLDFLVSGPGQAILAESGFLPLAGSDDGASGADRQDEE